MAATDELALLERVFLRVGTAETDDQLQNAISKFLLPVLLKLSSQQDGVRKKVMELLVHINKRVKSRSTIQLPVEALLVQYQDPSATSFVVNFTIIYIKLGYPRMIIEKQVELLPSLLNCIEGKPQSHQDSLLLILMPILGHIKPNSDPEKRKSLFGLHEKPKLSKLLVEFILDVLLLPYGSTLPLETRKATPQSGIVSTGAPAASTTLVNVPPGLSENSFKRVVGETPLTAEDLERTKLGIVKFLGAGYLRDEDVILPLIVASSDTRHSVVGAAELEVKRLIGGFNVTPQLISKMYSLFLGDHAIATNARPIQLESKRSAVNGRIRMKLMPYLMRSREAAAQFPACMQLVFDCLFSPSGTSQKLKHMAVEFVHHICLNSDESRLMPIAPLLLAGMDRVLAEIKDDAKLRGLAYVAIAKIGHKCPALVCKDMRFVQLLFDAASEEVQETRLALHDALSILCSTFKDLDAANARIMEGLLASCLEKPEPRVRMIAVQYVATIFPLDHIPSRYLLLLSAGDAKEEVYIEASKALKTIPTKSTGSTSSNFPPFADMMSYLSEKADGRLKSKQKYIVGTQALPFSPVTCTECVSYLRMCLAHSAGVMRIEDADPTDDNPVIAKYVRRLLNEEGPGERGSISLYLGFIKQLLVVTGGALLMYNLLEIVSMASELLASQFVFQIDWIKEFMFQMKEDIRNYACQLYAIVVSECFDTPRFAVAVNEMMKLTEDKVPERRQAGIYALGYSLARKASLLARTGLTLEYAVPDSVGAVRTIVTFLRDADAFYVSPACVAIGEIGRFATLPLPNESADDNDKSKLSIIKDLANILKSTKFNAKLQEKAATAIGYVCVGESGFSHRKVAMELLLETSSLTKDVDLHLTVGESLAWITLGSTAPVGRDFWTTTAMEFMTNRVSDDLADERLRWLLSEICTKYITSQNPNVRQVACVWLLSLLKCCGSQPAIKEHVGKLQEVFIELLSENNETTQDVASKGLGLVYEGCDEEQKKALLSVLVDTLTNGRRPTQRVTDDTKVFEEGTLGTAPQGGGLSTYKEICSLASDLNKPDLIYKFMHLANHNAMWNSKKGAAFGFGTIASTAGEQLRPYLPQIIPKLYRYRYDPNGKIQQSMSGIWNAIVTEPQKMIDLYTREILADLLVNLTSNMWRTRESCCLALIDLLKTCQMADIVDDLAQLWEICFRVSDDIKESVRLAAEAALKALHKVTIKLCDCNTGDTGKRGLGYVLPVLVKAGMHSPVFEVRTASLTTIVGISKKAGSLLKQHIPLLTVALLDALSSLESKELSYLSVRLGNQQDSQEKLDMARIEAARMSVMMDTIKQCLPFIDDEVMAELMPRLVDLIKSTIGLGTKAGAAHVIVLLVHHCPILLRPHAGKVLYALLFGLNDRSLAVRKTYAVAIGHVVKVAKDSSVEKLIDRLRTSFLEKDEISVRQTCGNVLNSISKQSADVLKLHAANVLPLAFVAMQSVKRSNDNAEDISVWEEIWADETPGSEAGVRLYLVEIVELVQVCLNSQGWSLKAKGAAAVEMVATKLRASLGSPHLETLVRTVLIGLGGRTWEGKEHLLKGLAAICVNCRDAIVEAGKADPSIAIEEILTVMMKECRKENVLYKREALHCTGDILHATDNDRFEDVYGLIKPSLERSLVRKGENEDGDSGDDDDDENKTSTKHLELQDVYFEVLGKSWPTSQPTQEKFQLSFGTFLCTFLENSTPRMQLSAMKALNYFFKRLQCLQAESIEQNKQQLEEILDVALPAICACATNTKSSGLRHEILAIFEVILKHLSAGEKDLSTILHNERLNPISAVTKQIVEESQSDLSQQGKQVLKYLQFIQYA